jgi:outer membrane receptor for ferrienterochelin and colicin
MKRFLGLLILCSQSVFAQNIFKALVTAEDTHQALAGVTVSIPQVNKSTITDSKGLAIIRGLSSGTYTAHFTYVGYKDTTITMVFPASDSSILQVVLQPEAKTEEQVIITTMRTNSRIADLPMKVEVLGLEDLQEESGIKPGNIAGLLGDLSVIHIQNTSAVTGNSAIRMQGLSGRYTQLLRDGLPVYEGLSTNFGVLSIPPLDLKQIEIIKGSASTLYGGGAIAGLINFISKTPGQEPQLDILVNRSTLKETNANLYYAQRWNKLGITLFAGTTLQNAVDVNNDGFSDVPQVRQYTIHPKLFFYLKENQTLSLGYTGTVESRKGGDMIVLSEGKEGLHQFMETDKSNRHSMDMQYQQRAVAGGNLVIKGVVSYFHLNSQESSFSLVGRQINTYGEASFNKKSGNHDWVAGINYLSEGFDKNASDTSGFMNYHYNTQGAFLQDDWHLTQKLMVEAGIRTDHHNRFGWFALPRLAFMYRPMVDLSIRLSAGTGYKIPTEFTSTNEQISIKDLSPDVKGLQPEKSRGLNFDINYHKRIDKIDLTINQALYYTHISDPVAPLYQTDNKYHLQNLPYHTNSKGTDTYIRLQKNRVELYLGYNHTLARYSNDKRNYELFAPQDKFSTTLAYELEEKWRMGVESSWAGNQYISFNQKAPNYWFFAAMIQRSLGKHVSLVLNCENLFDARQGKHEPLYTGSISDPQFYPLWGPIDGRVVNLSVKWSR